MALTKEKPVSDSKGDPITGRVAKVLNSRELVINRGATHGVRVGMKFQVLDATAHAIEDPETGEALGSVERPKLEVKIATVDDRLAVATTFHERRVKVGGGVNIGGMFEPPRYETRPQTLKTDEHTWEDLDESESFVKTGDPVRQMR